jgi:hypothetical protein
VWSLWRENWLYKLKKGTDGWAIEAEVKLQYQTYIFGGRLPVWAMARL